MQAFFARLVSLLLFFVTTTLGFGTKTEPEQIDPEDFVPVLRFAVYSDTHIDKENDYKTQRIRDAVEFAYRIAEEDEYYDRLDAVLFAGDTTNSGTEEQFGYFADAVKGAVRGDTKILAVHAHNHDGYEFGAGSLAYVEALTGENSDFHVLINGYHFIGLSRGHAEPFLYDEGQRIWLRRQLNDAVLDDPEKPIFVMHHEHVTGTVYGSSLYEGWGKPYFSDILADYPQIVDFSGHSHYPLNDPRSLWQGAFTAVGTGSMAYMELTIGTDRSLHPEGSGDTAQGWIVEVDADNRVRLRGYDVTLGEWLVEYILNDVDNKASFAYTEAKMKAASSAPAFAEDTRLTVLDNGDGTYTVTVPQAQSTDGKIILRYCIKVTDKIGLPVDNTYVVNNYWSAKQMDLIRFTVKAKTGNTIKVVAENAYGMQSEPLTAVVG